MVNGGVLSEGQASARAQLGVLERLVFSLATVLAGCAIMAQTAQSPRTTVYSGYSLTPSRFEFRHGVTKL